MPTTNFLRDVLTIAVESGIDYWAECREARREPEKGGRYIYIEVRDQQSNDLWVPVDEKAVSGAIAKITDGGAVIRNDIKVSIAEAVTMDDAGMIDAEAADCIVQIATYGEIVFG